MRLELLVSGAEESARDMLAFSERAADAAPGLHLVADLIRAQIRRRFDQQGPGWAPLAETTKAAKAAAGLDPRILRATEALMDSWIREGGSHVEHLSAAQLILSSSISYGGFQQRGTRNMPARKIVDFTEADKRAQVKVIQRFIVEGERGAATAPFQTTLALVP